MEEGRPEELFVRPGKQEIRDFLRDRSEKLPADGINIQLFFNGANNYDPVVTQMARTLDTNFSICWAKLEDFRQSVYGSLVINTNETDKDRILKFLDENNVAWEVID